MSRMEEAASLGQAIWLDYIHRSLLTSGELERLIDQGLRGITSNPTIFEKAIAHGDTYDPDLRQLAVQGSSAESIYEALVVDDIQRAADLFAPVYEETSGADGYVSLEANPHLADDTAATLDEVRRLNELVARPNVLFKVPATPAGIPAIQMLIAEGISVNITLIFSRSQYEPVIEAYLSGLEQRREAGQDISQLASVASFFVSRVDTAVDRALGERGETGLQGRIAIASAKLAYARFREILNTSRWQNLARAGARVQYVLWGSTSTKNPDYPDTMYVDELMGPYTVDTMPPETLDAFLDHGSVTMTLESGLREARSEMMRLARLGIDLEVIAQKLQRDGVSAFARSYDELLAAIDTKRRRFFAEGGKAITVGSKH